MTGTGGARPRRRVVVRGEKTKRWLSALVRAQGHEVVEQGPADLWLVEPEYAQEAPRGAKLIRVATQRMRPPPGRGWLDTESSVLDLWRAISEALFANRVEERRHARVHGALTVRFSSNHLQGTGALVAIHGAGAFLLTELELPECTPLVLEAEVGDRTLVFHGRVACEYADATGGSGVEFALEHDEVSPRLGELFGTRAIGHEDRTSAVV